MEYKEFLDKVAKLTDQNFHTEARIEIAKYFGFEEQLDKLKLISSRNNW